jgi:ATP-dependent DNA helicase RecG
MPITIEKISAAQAQKLLDLQESHFVDVKRIEIAPAKLTRTICAFANADGGELFIGIDETEIGFRWRGFPDQEAANGHIQPFEQLFPLGQYFAYEFLACDGQPGLVLKAEVRKTPDIRKASDGNVYVRRSAANLRITEQEDLRRLQFAKGITSFETETVQAEKTLVTNSTEVISFMLEVVPTRDPEEWLKKQGLLRGDQPTVCGVLLFAEEPQALLPKRSGVKIHRYRTAGEPSRDTMAFTPLTIEGPSYKQILAAVAKTQEVIQQAFTLGDNSLEAFKYPVEALHEIITNAVIHRDYSIADDIHIRVFDNRIEVESPGRLPAHITPENILDERFSRNGNLVRLLNRYPDPPNKDIGEGLNTAFSAMRKLGLKEPRVENRANSVLVSLRHERLASHEELILEYLEKHDSIRNKEARELCHVDADYVMRRIFGRLEKRKLIEKIPGAIQAKTAYSKGANFENWRAALKSSPPGIDLDGD